MSVRYFYIVMCSMDTANAEVTRHQMLSLSALGLETTGAGTPSPSPFRETTRSIARDLTASFCQLLDAWSQKYLILMASSPRLEMLRLAGTDQPEGLHRNHPPWL